MLEGVAVDVDVGKARLEARMLPLFRRCCERWQDVGLVLACALVGVVVGEWLVSEKVEGRKRVPVASGVTSCQMPPPL